jgi:glucuronate isomerase
MFENHRDPIAEELLAEMASWPVFDPHSHINPHSPAARSLDEILGYHYYTELTHSAGMPANLVDPALPASDRVRNLAAHLDRIDNTVQYSWLVEIARAFHSWEGSRLTPEAIVEIEHRANKSAAGTAWDETVWHRTQLEAVFLTNEFDDPLEGWDTSRYVPCLRTDDLVLKLHLPQTLERLRRVTNVDVRDYTSLRLALGSLFGYFVERGARACAISLPPDFVPEKPGIQRAGTALRRALHAMDLRPDEHAEVRKLVFWTLAELCAEHRLPFDLMIGPIRDIYPAGVAGGRDLFDRRVSLKDYAPLFRHFAGVTFPVSTLSPDAGAELVAYAWIFPNVLPMGHWWYSNIPQFIAPDLAARLQAVPKVKLVGYYSDAYKLEFIQPKFAMYRRILASVLARDAVRERGWTTAQALEVARLILLENPRRIFALRKPG